MILTSSVVDINNRYKLFVRPPISEVNYLCIVRIYIGMHILCENNHSYMSLSCFGEKVVNSSNFLAPIRSYQNHFLFNENPY